MDNQQLWNKTVEFHGHECPGLMIGYRAAIYAGKLLDHQFSEDEEIVCIAENDTCSIDAIQAVLGCTAGKGNLILDIRGKQAFSFFNRNNGKSVRLVQRGKPRQMSRDESIEYYRTCPEEEMFDVKETTRSLPAKARIFESYICESCGEKTGEKWIRLLDGKKLCLDCYGQIILEK